MTLRDYLTKSNKVLDPDKTIFNQLHEIEVKLFDKIEPTDGKKTVLFRRDFMLSILNQDIFNGNEIS